MPILRGRKSVPGMNAVRGKWKEGTTPPSHGMLSHYKARLMVNSSTQLEGVDVDDIVLTTSSKILLQQIIRSLHHEFAMTDLDWAGCPTTRCLTSGYCVFLGNKLLSWSFKRQPMLSRSNAEVEYHGVANAVTETCWLGNLLCELHTPLSSTTLIYCDNVSAVYLSCNPVQHQRTKCGLLLSMWCMYDAYNEHGDYTVARLEIDSFDETAYAVIVMFDETSEEQ
nr:ribonuclease H-like domain-containing protein [Tanacetum cinerariifolium]